ncbi:MAG: hypothetical protein V2I36_06825 [Desulfopila sp.]|jgi:spermidine synthase|nr:hypothetical protein [Desulfopila sp.]
MSSQPKKVLHVCREKNFTEVVEQGEYRSLHFQGSVVQSRIALNEPGRLVLRYTHYMMAASLLVMPRPSRVLLIGIGAGALLQFFKHHLPLCYIDAVDYSQHVIDIAREYFHLPENGKIAVHCDDGLHFLAGQSVAEPYDIILLDAFNDNGMARNIYSNEFFKLAGQSLSSRGIICGNLWSGDRREYARVKKAIVKHSAASVFIPVRQRENIVALLFRSSVPWSSLCPANAVLHVLADRYKIDFKEVSAAAKSTMKLGEKLQCLFH